MSKPAKIGVGRYDVIDEQHFGNILIHLIDPFLEPELVAFQYFSLKNTAGCRNNGDAGKEDDEKP